MTNDQQQSIDVKFGLGDQTGSLPARTRDEAQALLDCSIADTEDEVVLALVDGSVVGAVRVALRPSCPRAFLGALPASEAHMSRVAVAEGCWQHLPELLRGTRRRIAQRHGLALQWTVRETQERCEELRSAAEASGMTLFQEKQGFGWDQAHPPVLEPTQLDYRTITEVGVDAYRGLLARCGDQTLDRNDAWYRSRAGVENWGHAFMGYNDPAHANTWLVAHDASGEPVGFIAISDFDDAATGTIIYVGVLPEHRGRGVVDDLLRRGSAAAREAGFTRMLSDADVLNRPMCEAFVRNGHRPDLRPWHKWHFRFPVERRTP